MDTFKETVQEHCFRLKVHSAKLSNEFPPVITPINCCKRGTEGAGNVLHCISCLHRHYVVLINKTQCVTRCVSSN